MENLDLTSLSPEQREKVLAIVNENSQPQKPIRSNVMDVIRSSETPESIKIKEEYLAGLKNVKVSDEYEKMDYDTKSDFNDAISGIANLNTFSSGIAERRRKGQLTHADKVTYKQLEAIHESGSPSDFWNKVRGAVESKKHIDLSDVSDELDSDTRRLLNEKNKK